MPAAPILTKQQNFRLWQSGAFGNKLRAWRTIDEWWAGDYKGPVVLRTLLPSGGGGPCVYNLNPNEVESVALIWSLDGIPRDWIMVNEYAPGHTTILQGEYLNDIYTLDGEARWGFFYYSRARAPMRKALVESSAYVDGLRADLMLCEAMTPGSYEDWQALLERYPRHVFEVSIYDGCIGDLPNRNTLVWEVRRY